MAPGSPRRIGLLIAGAPPVGLLTCAVLVLDRTCRVVHAELVGESTLEPDHDAVLAAARRAV